MNLIILDVGVNRHHMIWWVLLSWTDKCVETI